MRLGSSEVTSKEGVVAGANNVEAKLVVVGYSDESPEEDEVEGWMEGEVAEEDEGVVFERENRIPEELADFVEGRVEGGSGGSASDAVDKVEIQIGGSRIEGEGRGSGERGRRGEGDDG